MSKITIIILTRPGVKFAVNSAEGFQSSDTNWTSILSPDKEAVAKTTSPSRQESWQVSFPIGPTHSLAYWKVIKSQFKHVEFCATIRHCQGHCYTVFSQSFLQTSRLPTFLCGAVRQPAVSAVRICWVPSPPTVEICHTPFMHITDVSDLDFNSRILNWAWSSFCFLQTMATHWFGCVF